METSPPPLEDVVALLAVVVVVPVMVAVAAALHHLDLDQQGLLKLINLNNHGVYAVYPFRARPAPPPAHIPLKLLMLVITVIIPFLTRQ